jgi:hypothetical protein
MLKPIVAQIVNKYPTFSQAGRVYYRAHKSYLLSHILSQMNPFHNLTPYFLKILLI